jgi:hypothetical protein
MDSGWLFRELRTVPDSHNPNGSSLETVEKTIGREYEFAIRDLGELGDDPP